MTTAEFDKWVTAKYPQLLEAARRVGGDADTVQSAVVVFLTNQDLAAVRQPWTYLVNAIRNRAGHARRSQKRRDKLARQVKIIRDAGASSVWRRPARRAD